jgi:hydroxymethylbilane synthase
VRRQILVGSRGSTLALAQANEVIKTLRECAPDVSCKVVAIKTKGDKLHESGESTIESKSVFTKEIEDSLLRGEIQIAVHSMKDLTTDLPSELTIAAVPRRADHRDALISRGNRKFDALPGGARVGTSSPRRRTQLLAARSDLGVADVHGNVDTRLRKLDGGSYDAIVLAAAGLVRLGLEKRVTEFLSTKIMLPAIGQGALAIEARKDDPDTLQLVSRLEDKPTRQAVEAERAFARKLGANCRTPIAAYARLHEGKLAIDGMVSSHNGRMLLRGQLVADKVNPAKVGEELAESLLGKGAQLMLEAE